MKPFARTILVSSISIVALYGFWRTLPAKCLLDWP